MQVYNTEKIQITDNNRKNITLVKKLLIGYIQVKILTLQLILEST